MLARSIDSFRWFAHDLDKKLGKENENTRPTGIASSLLRLVDRKLKFSYIYCMYSIYFYTMRDSNRVGGRIFTTFRGEGDENFFFFLALQLRLLTGRSIAYF